MARVGRGLNRKIHPTFLNQKGKAMNDKTKFSVLFIVAVLAGIFFTASLDGFLNKNQAPAPLPDIAGEFFTTVITDDGPESQKLLSFFESNPDLKRVQQRERHNELSSTDPYYLENFKPRLEEADKFPLVVVQRPNGNTCLVLSKDTIPETSEGLAGLFRRRCRPNNPAPDKPEDPAPVEEPKEEGLIADTIKNVVTGGGEGDGSLIGFIISLLASGGWLTRDIMKKFGQDVV